eukprot:TRINITY_DN26153_c0_g1_i1.p1 TRINITY_DN26153_c0_g1~~TRINITY_DN26153_c0_g1_i1.p1  ORF type:complete len:186 (+),score=12.56 TRINITY_DN26153_c0_g1_i1:48-605(+)
MIEQVLTFVLSLTQILLPQSTLNSNIYLTTNGQNMTFTSKGFYKYDSRSDPIRNHLQLVDVDSGSTVNDYSLFTSNEYFNYFQYSGICINTTIDRSSPEFPVCTAWVNGTTANTLVSTCTLTDDYGPLSLAYTLALDSTTGMISQIAALITRDSDVVVQNVQIVTPNAAAPVPADFTLPSVCLSS